MLSELGFVDTMLIYSKSDLMILEEKAGVNPYAAMPSMHFAYAFIVGIWGGYLSEQSIKPIFPIYTLFVCFGILITGNHFIMDCIVSLVIILFSLAIVSTWTIFKKFCKSMCLVVARKPNYWWMYILLFFATFVVLFHTLLRVIKTFA
jgi:hypothetical protein